MGHNTLPHNALIVGLMAILSLLERSSRHIRGNIGIARSSLAVVMGIVALFLAVGSAHALSPTEQKPSKPAEEQTGPIGRGASPTEQNRLQPVEVAPDCESFSDYGVCISDMDNDGHVDDWDFVLWAQANPGEFACADLRRTYESRFWDPNPVGEYNPLDPLSPSVVAQFNSLQFFSNDSGVCWGNNPHGELVVVRTYDAKTLGMTAHWESDGNNGTHFLRQWPVLLGYDADGHRAEGDDIDSRWHMSLNQEIKFWLWVSHYGRGAVSPDGYKFAGCEPYDMDPEFDRCVYEQVLLDNDRYTTSEHCSNDNSCRVGEPNGATVATYTINGFLVSAEVLGPDQGQFADFFVSDRKGYMTLADYSEGPCPLPLTKYDRWGWVVGSETLMCPPMLVPPPPPPPPTPDEPSPPAHRDRSEG